MADRHIGNHPNTAFGIVGENKGQGIDYETKTEYLSTDILFGAGPAGDPNCQVAISFSPTLFNNRLELQTQLRETFQQINATITASKDQASGFSSSLQGRR